MRGAVRIVFDALDLAWHAILVTQEIDQTVLLLVTAALVAHGLTAEVVARASAILADDQRLFRLALMQVRTGDRNLEASTWRCRF